jgi:hypothetical protein
MEQEFFEITGFPPGPRLTNTLVEKELRKDRLFQSLANLVFDSPEILHLLKSRVGSWLEEEFSERTQALAGYIAYLDEDYQGAASSFMAAVTMNPANLDSWLDLAFSLYHLSDPMGYAIIFNYDVFITLYSQMAIKQCCRESLEKIEAEMLERGLELSQNPGAFLPQQKL